MALEHIADWDDFYLGMAAYMSCKSKDPSTRVGAVIVRPDRTHASSGFNGLPPGIADTAERLHNRELKYQLIRHAEANACALAREPLHGYTLYVWPLPPCAQCAAMLIAEGIKRVIAPSVPPGSRWLESAMLGREVLEEAGVAVEWKPWESAWI
ncbi:deoxycytidylate deaminase [Billgrantia desiderata]|uniref:deoxycytidylate deaminase n=1 Tax=Billgrantia desiderata TaxID=52021 RepID=UPI001F279FED|nr:deaminase [Halomonas desiderata]MCE8012877.1 hypothetical protein [Halomonas desiderata]